MLDAIAFQSTQLLRGGTNAEKVQFPALTISIHPPPARWDPSVYICSSIHFTFQSTHLLRGGTGLDVEHVLPAVISIHPPPARWDHAAPPCHAALSKFQSTHLLRGGTAITTPCATKHRNFNPPTSCEVGPGVSGSPLSCMRRFQSTHLLRGGTRLTTNSICAEPSISIHPPPARWDMDSARAACMETDNFNPPTSCEVGRKG